MKCFTMIPRRVFLGMFLYFLLFYVAIFLLSIILLSALNDSFNVPFFVIILMAYYFIPKSLVFASFTVPVYIYYYFVYLFNSKVIVSIQNIGTSAWCIIHPVLFATFLISLSSFFLMDWDLSIQSRINEVVVSHMEPVLYSTLRDKKELSFGENFNLTVAAVEGSKLIQPLILFNKNDPSSTIISAESAELRVGNANKIISPDEVCFKNLSDEIYPYNPKDTTFVAKLSFRNISVQHGTQSGSNEMERNIVLEQDHINRFLPIQQSTASRPADMTLAKLADFIKEQQQIISSTEQEIAIQTALLLQHGNSSKLSSSQWKDEYSERIRQSEKNIARSKIELTRRLTSAFGCFFCTLLTIPFALLPPAFSKQNKETTDYYSINNFFQLAAWIAFYYLPWFLILGIVKKGIISPLFLWVPAIVILLIGIKRIRRVL